LFSALNHLADGSARLCVLGDLNLPNFDWNLFVYPENFLYNTAAEFVLNHGLTQLVDEPTRGDNILDIVLCSDVLCIDDVCLLPPIASSDHDVVSFKLFTSLLSHADVPVTSTQPNFSKANWDGLRDFMSSICWQSEFANCKSVQEYWDKFLLFVNEGVHEFVPLFKPTRHSSRTKVYCRRVRKLRERSLVAGNSIISLKLMLYL